MVSRTFPARNNIFSLDQNHLKDTGLRYHKWQTIKTSISEICSWRPPKSDQLEDQSPWTSNATAAWTSISVELWRKFTDIWRYYSMVGKLKYNYTYMELLAYWGPYWPKTNIFNEIKTTFIVYSIITIK